MTEKSRISTIIIICCALSIIIGAVMSAHTMIENGRERRTFEQIEKLAETDDTESTDGSCDDAFLSASDVYSAPAWEECGELSESGGQKKKNRIGKLKEENGECIGWVSISGTGIDYPLMHSPAEPEKYLSKNFYGQKSASGVPFLDARCDLQNSDNLIIYGHRMKNGTMFSILKKYRKQSFWKEHPSVTVEFEDGKHSFFVFAVMTTDKLDTWYRFVRYLNEDEYDLMMQYAKNHSLYDTGAVPQYGTRLVSLSSCYGSGKDGRIIVIGMEEE